MKVCIIQPQYSVQYEDSDKCFAEMLNMLDRCDSSIDLIVLPEYSDVPALAHNSDAFLNSQKNYTQCVLRKAAETARRCQALVFVNARSDTKSGWRNTTHAINQKGENVGKYYKRHMVASEEKRPGIDRSYCYRYEKPYVVEIDGVRYGFLTCYDFYFYESYSQLALQNVDVIIGCSHQRSGTHQALDIIGRFVAYHTNAYLLRSSVSMGEDFGLGGCSMIVAPDGTKLADLHSKIGMVCCELNPHEKYWKPAGFGGDTMAHYSYIEKGRHPWNYRIGGPAIIPDDDHVPYPRVCAHRGFNTIAP